MSQSRQTAKLCSFRPNWESPIPSPEATVFPPFLVWGGGTHSLSGEGWGGGPNSDEETESVLYSRLYVLCGADYVTFGGGRHT
jgi:hypothetical protein